MSFDLIWKHEPGTFRSSTHLLVALTICRHTRTDGQCYAYLRTLAKRSMLHKKTVSKCIAELAEDGIITVSATPGQNGGNGANIIRMSMSGVVDSMGPGDDLEPTVHEARIPGRAGLPRSTPALGTDDSDPTPRTTPTGTAQDSGKKDNGTINVTTNETTSGAASPRASLDDYREIIDRWNRMAISCGLPKASLTKKRQESMNARVSEQDESWSGLMLAIDNVRLSKFLLGENARGWRCTIDFLLSPSGFHKVYEGTYTDPEHRQKKANARAPGAVLASLREGGQFARTMVSKWTQDANSWTDDMGPAPDQPGCVVPRALLERFSFPLPVDLTHGPDALAYALQGMKRDKTPPGVASITDLPTVIGVDLGREHGDDEVPL